MAKSKFAHFGARTNLLDMLHRTLETYPSDDLAMQMRGEDLHFEVASIVHYQCTDGVSVVSDGVFVNTATCLLTWAEHL